MAGSQESPERSHVAILQHECVAEVFSAEKEIVTSTDGVKDLCILEVAEEVVWILSDDLLVAVSCLSVV